MQPIARQTKANAAALGYSGERALNMFLRPGDGVSQGMMIGRSGAVAHATLLAGAVGRASVDVNGVLYVCAGGALYSVTTAGVATKISGKIADDRKTFMATDGTQVAIVANQKYWVYDGATLSEYATGAISNPSAVAFQDGYFIVTGAIGDRDDAFTVSNIDDATTFNALDFAYAENAPDAIVNVVSDHGQLWLFGTKTVEVFWNSGNVDFPFERNSGALIEEGCLDGKTVAQSDNSVFWVRPDRAVLRSAGGVAQVISTREIQEALTAETVKFGLAFTDKGHKFYAVTTDKSSYCYDITTGVWHERTYGTDAGREWWVVSSSTIAGTEYLLTDTGLVVTTDPDTYTDNGATIVGEATTAPIEQGGNPFSVSRVIVQARSGATSTTTTPQIALATTRDGRTWTNWRQRDLGNIGIYYRQAVWVGLGSFRRFQCKVRITDPVPHDIYGINYA